MAGIDSFTVLALHCDGADASTTFTNTAIAAHTVTAVGNAQLDTAQSKFGGASALFDGTGDYLTNDGSADFAFGTGDFTVEFFVRLNAVGAVATLFDCRPFGSEGVYPNIYLDTANQLNYFVSSADRINGTTALTTGQFYHVAIARSGTSTKLFLDGVQEGSTYSDSNSYLIGTSRPTFAVSGADLANAFNGWIDEIHISKGAARYTANFTPPAAAFFHESAGASAGVGAAAGVGRSTAASAGAASGTGAALADSTGSGVNAGVGTATGTGAAYGIAPGPTDVIGECAVYKVRGRIGANYTVEGAPSLP